MSMSVRKLISLLKKMPPDAKIAVRDHDQSDGEINGWPRHIELIHSSDLEQQWNKDRNTQIVVIQL